MVASGPATPSESLHHSKSVPNLIPVEVEQPPSPGAASAAAPATPVLSEASFSFLDPDKRMRVTDNTLKLIQKQGGAKSVA